MNRYKRTNAALTDDINYMNARKIRLNFIKIIVPVLFIAFSCSPKIVTVNDSAGILGKTHAPVSVKMNWANKYEPALVEITDNGEGEEIPVRLKKNETDSELILVMPAGKPGIRKFKVVRKTASLPPVMVVEKDSGSGQFVIKESGKSVLQYNYQTVNEDNVIRVASKKDIKPVYKPVSFPAGNVYRDEYLKSHPEIKDNVITSAIWAVPRSNYIHPLYGLNGEMLTNDWPDGSHPHHRGIFWAWPEVEYKSQHGDLYALLRVFARPTGNIKYTSGSVFAEIDAENLWMWKDKEPIVREQVTIRVYRSSQESRVIDLTVSLLAMVDSVTVATRSTNSYGGLCFRMETPQKQDISYYSDKPGASPARAWGDFNGIFEGNQSASGLTILQHRDNPEYPGTWVEYPNLSWLQPTFPTPGTRFLLSKETPLTLRYRFIVHQGGKPDDAVSTERWDAYHFNNHLTN